MVKFDTIYSNLSYSSSKLQFFAAKDSQYNTFILKLKRTVAKIVNLGFFVDIYLNIQLYYLKY